MLPDGAPALGRPLSPCGGFCPVPSGTAAWRSPDRDSEGKSDLGAPSNHPPLPASSRHMPSQTPGMATDPSPDTRLWPRPAVLPHRRSRPSARLRSSCRIPPHPWVSAQGAPSREPALCRSAHLPRLHPSAVWGQGEEPAGPSTGLVLVSHHRVPKAPRVVSAPRTCGEGRSAEAKADVQNLIKWDPGYWVALLGRSVSRLDLWTRSPALGASSSPVAHEWDPLSLGRTTQGGVRVLCSSPSCLYGEGRVRGGACTSLMVGSLIGLCPPRGLGWSWPGGLLFPCPGGIQENPAVRGRTRPAFSTWARGVDPGDELQHFGETQELVTGLSGHPVRGQLAAPRLGFPETFLRDCCVPG